jgi:hypothetical protein
MIKNKNGKEFKISKPNPIMKFQELWEKYTIHNFFWEEFKETNLFKKSKNIKDIKEKIKEKEEEEEIKEQIEEQIEEQEKEKVYEKISKFKNQCYYIEAQTTIKKDNLYDDAKIKIKYKEKITIMVEIKQHNDLYLQFLSTKKLNKNSIIFPKNKDKRWWKIIEEKEEEDIYAYSCIPSDFAPSFG